MTDQRPPAILRTWPARHTALAVLLALGSATAGFGLVDLLSPLILHEGMQVSDVGYGSLAGILVPVGLLAAAGSSAAGLRQVAAAALAYLIAGVLSGNGPIVTAGAVVGAAALLTATVHPDRSRLRMCSSRPSVALLAAALAACLPGTLYALHMAVNQRDGVLPADSHLGLGHWAALSAAALTTLFTAVLAGLCEARRVHGFSAAAAASLWALTCVAYPESAGALGRTWAGLALVWAAAFALLSHREARRARFGFIQQAPTKGKP